MTDQEAFDKAFAPALKSGLWVSRQEVWETALAYARRLHIAPTDVTDPPPGWSWALILQSVAGEKRMSVIVTQTTPTRERLEVLTSDSMTELHERATAMRKAWNDEAKAAGGAISA